jgi:hypothetical protein
MRWKDHFNEEWFKDLATGCQGFGYRVSGIWLQGVRDYFILEAWRRTRGTGGIAKKLANINDNRTFPA